MMIFLQICGWFVAMVVLMSIIEHQVHRGLMHHQPRNFLTRGLAFRRRIFTSHAIEHHDQYRRSFHDDPVPRGADRGIRLCLHEGLIEALPVSLALCWFSTIGAIMFPVVVCMHHVMWNQIHLEMHKPERRFFSNWAAYKHVARHHFLHHRYPTKNFNVALPVGDYLFGTVAKATPEDILAMQAEGIA